MTINKIIAGIVLSFWSLVIYAAPVFTFHPLTLTTVTVSPTGTAIIQYKVTNQSRKNHTLLMIPIAGITQIASVGNCSIPFKLAYKQSCILTLRVNGNQLPANIVGGPKVCQQGPDGNPNPLMCYQPRPANILNITLGGVTQYIETPQAGSNGTISPSTTQTVNSGGSLTFTATPNPGFQVAQWLVDGNVAQTGGTTFTLTNITQNHIVLVTFSLRPIVYSGAENGSVYFSSNNGANWNATGAQPGGGQAIIDIFATHNALYAATIDNLLHYSTNNGETWNNTNIPASDTALHGFFVLEKNDLNQNVIYWTSDAGVIYKSINNGSSWTPLPTAIPGPDAINAIFAVAGTPNKLYAGSADGFVYYSTNDGNSWIPYSGTLDGSQIRSVFVTNTMVFANTQNEYAYTNTSLTGGANLWNPYAQTVFSLFANADGSLVYAGTQGGYLFSLSTGNELGFITNSPVNSVYVLQ